MSNPSLGPSPITYGLHCDVFKRALPPRDTAPRGMTVAHVSSNNGRSQRETQQPPNEPPSPVNEPPPPLFEPPKPPPTNEPPKRLRLMTSHRPKSRHHCN